MQRVEERDNLNVGLFTCECVCLVWSTHERPPLVIAQVLFNRMNANLGLFPVIDSLP